MNESHRTIPFVKANSSPKRLKLFIWGDPGVGKTTLALQFPRPVAIDLEGGCDLFGGRFQFDVLRTTSPDTVNEAIAWLTAHDHDYATLVLDPVTVYWDALQRKWSDIFLQRNKGSRGHKHEFYELGPKEWMSIKADWKAFVRDLIGLDMNVVVAARAKPQYAAAGFMRAVGTTFDAEKSMPYLFDVVLRLYRDDQGQFLAEAIKDRTGQLPKTPFAPTIEVFRSLLHHPQEKQEA